MKKDFHIFYVILVIKKDVDTNAANVIAACRSCDRRSRELLARLVVQRDDILKAGVSTVKNGVSI
jgi:hypothetical protein